MLYKTIFQVIMFVVEGFMIFYYGQSLFKTKKNSITIALWTSVIYLSFLLVHLNANGLINTIYLLLINFLLLFYLFDCKLKNAIFHSFILSFLMIITEFISVSVTSILFKVDFNTYTNDPNMYILNVAFSKMIYFLLCLLMTRVFNRSKGQFGSASRFWILIIVPISSLAALTVLFNAALNMNFSEAYKIASSISAALLIISNIVLFFIYERSIRDAAELLELKAAEQKAETDKTYFEILEKNNDNLKIFTHDIKNHLLHISNLAQNEEVTDYITDLCGTVTNFGNYAMSKNKTLDIIINKYLLLCESKKIHIYFDTKTANLAFIESPDLTALLNNLLDNAVEAAELSSEKEILVKLFTKNNSMQVIKIVNSCNTEPNAKNNNLLTIKTDKNLHGLGLKSVKKIVNKYNGSFEWKYKKDDNLFEICIIF
ncbi:MAG: GHKL domain-containing protein [Clostridia bacterium]|nr:GHKL domain-containing protein [Clostridia bacterium]